MKYLFLLVVISMGCKESTSTLAAVAPEIPFTCPIVDVSATDIWEPISAEIIADNGAQYVGACIARQGDYAWVMDATENDYFYAVSLLDGSIRGVDSLIFTDAACTSVIGELYTYPLHLSGDTYVFSFEGAMYEYVMGGGNDWALAGNYYIKTPAGTCDPYVAIDNTVRLVQDSTFSRSYLGPLQVAQ